MTRWPMVVALVAVVMPEVAWGHARSVSYSSWRFTGDAATVRARVTTLDLNEAAGANAGQGVKPDAYLTSRLTLAAEGCAVVDGSITERAAEPGWLARQWQLECEAVDGATVRSTLFADVLPQHVHFARIVVPARGLDEERLLTANEPTTDITATGRTHLSGYILLGVEHILTGWDHLVFLLALIILGGSLKRLAAIVTGFTVGHSITLALAVLDIAQPRPGPTEALIGLSIVIIALENVWLDDPKRRWHAPVALAAVIAAFALALSGPWAPVLGGMLVFAGCYFALLARAAEPARLRWSVAALFGLIHGLGFAGALNELRPAGQSAAVPLFGFNLGVELGQLAIVVLAWPAIKWAHDHHHGPRLVPIGSAVAASLGAYWFVGRALG